MRHEYDHVVLDNEDHVVQQHNDRADNDIYHIQLDHNGPNDHVEHDIEQHDDRANDHDVEQHHVKLDNHCPDYHEHNNVEFDDDSANHDHVIHLNVVNNDGTHDHDIQHDDK